jgi:hypothetical protein
MRKLIGVVVLVGMFSMLAMAEGSPKPEVYGGYQFTGTDGGGHASGWNGAASLYVTRWLGVTGDFSGVYHSGSLYTYTFGPTVSARKTKFSPFAHALFGGARASSGGVSDSGMAMMFGGGVDIGGGKLALRAVQFDWLVLRFNGITDKNNYRVNTGLMYRF